MGRPKAPARLVLTPYMLDYLQRCCDDPTMGMVLTDRLGEQRIDLRVDIVRELLRMAQFGKGLATLNARSLTERSAAAKRASETRWSRVRARKRAAMAEHARSHGAVGENLNAGVRGVGTESAE